MRLLFVLSFFLYASIAYSFSVGGALVTESSPYKGAPAFISPLPVIYYDSDLLYIDFPSASLHIFNEDNYQLNLKVDYTSLKFNPTASGYTNMAHIEERKAALYGGTEFLGWGKYGIFMGSFAIDMIESYGVRAAASYLLYFKPIEGLKIFPEIGLRWFNATHNEYFFGVTEEESAASGFDEYDPQDSITPFIGTYSTYNFYSSFVAILKAEYSVLPKMIVNSPIIDKNTGYMLYLGLKYSF